MWYLKRLEISSCGKIRRNGRRIDAGKKVTFKQKSWKLLNTWKQYTGRYISILKIWVYTRSLLWELTQQENYIHLLWWKNGNCRRRRRKKFLFSVIKAQKFQARLKTEDAGKKINLNRIRSAALKIRILWYQQNSLRLYRTYFTSLKRFYTKYMEVAL